MGKAPTKKWRKWLRRTWISVGLVVLLLYVVVPLVVTPILRSRLQKQLSPHLRAELRMGGVYYVFPYGLMVTDALLVGKDEAGAEVELLKIPRLRMALAKLPFGSGPLVFKKVIMERPSIRLLSTDEGMVGNTRRLSADLPEPVKLSVASAPAAASQPAVASAPPPAKIKLSSMFQLEKIQIIDGSVIHEDRSAPRTVPAVWGNINMDLSTTALLNPIYQFAFKGSHGQLSEMSATGTLNIDELEIVITQMSFKANLQAGGKESPLPTMAQKMLLDNRVSGEFAVSGKMKLPLRKMEEAEFDIHLELANASATVAQWQSAKDPDRKTFDSITGKFRFSNEPLTEDQMLMSEAGSLRAQSSSAPKAKQKMRAAYLLAEDAQILMGDSVLLVKNAAMAYDRRLQEWQVKQARAVLTLGKQKEDLPKPLRAATEKPQFSGVIELVLDGEGTMNKPKGERRMYTMRLKASCPTLTMTPRKLVWHDVSGNMLMTPGLVQFVDEGPTHPAIAADLYGGKLIGHGTIRTGKPAHFDFAGSLKDVDLREFARDWTKSEEKWSKLSGHAFANFQISDSSAHAGFSAVDYLTASGVFEILDGEFYELPVVSEIGGMMAMNKDAGKVGQAAGKFSIEHRRVNFKSIAVAAPILGVHGQGTAKFDGGLDFKAVAAPLSDWKQAMEKTRIPLLDSVGADLMGGVQKILDSASGKLLYQFRITGTPGKPVINTEPAPILTEDGVKLLKEMLKGTGKLVDAI